MIGMTHGVPFSDPTRVVQTLSIERSYEAAEFWLCSQLIRLFSDSVVTLNLELEDTQSSGISNPNLGGSQVLESVQAAYVEETNSVPKIPRFPGQEIPDTARLLKAYAAGVRWLGLRATITVSGKGIQVWDEASQGSVVAATINSCDGPFQIIFPSGVKIEGIGKGSTNDGEVDTWTGEGVTFTNNPGATSQNVITVPPELQTLIPSPAVLLMQDTYVMSGDYKTNVRHTMQIQAHLAS